MKTRLFVLCYLLCVVLSGFAQTDGQAGTAPAPSFSGELAVWDQMFDQAGSVDKNGMVQEQYQFVQNVSDGNLDTEGTWYVKALHRLIIEFPDIKIRPEIEAGDSMARLLAQKLASLPQQAAAADLWQAVIYFNNPLVKADCLEALGKCDTAKAFLPQVVQLLTDRNNTPESDADRIIANERIVYGAILSLESYKDPAGYLPVFFAETGWYSQRIKQQASVCLPNIMDDPTEKLTTVINTPGYSYAIKYMALTTEEQSKSTDANKGLVAVAALNQGWVNRVTDIHQRQVLAQMRKYALALIRKYKPEAADDGTVTFADNSTANLYTAIDLSYKQGDMDEKLASCQALASLASENAAKLLASYAMTIHQRRMADTIDTADEQLIRVILPAIGNIGPTAKTAARPILVLIINSAKWTNTVINLARSALQKVGN